MTGFAAEPHYSAAEVYAALGCPYPGTTVLRAKQRHRANESSQQADRRGGVSTARDGDGDRRGEVISL